MVRLVEACILINSNSLHAHCFWGATGVKRIGVVAKKIRSLAQVCFSLQVLRRNSAFCALQWRW